MLNLGRFAVILIGVLTIVYVCLWFYWRSGQKMKLEEDWVMEGRPGDRDTWVDERLAPREAKLRPWLIFLVYVVPITALSVIVWMTN